MIPKEYKIKYGVTNLFRVELPLFWRMLYTLTDGETDIEIIAFVLDVLDHDSYNKNLVIQRDKKCLRVWPQDNNTDGFFVAKIRNFKNFFVMFLL